jgi:hypothetical protein
MRRVIVGCLTVLGSTLALGPAEAVWWGHSSHSSGYYNPTPTYYYCQPVVPYCCPPVVAGQPGGDLVPVPIYGKQYAQPKAAPPSETKEPPLDKKMPGPPQVIESRSFSVAEDKEPAKGGKGVCKVGFWNATGRDVKLVVNGQEHALARNRSLTLTLDREFAWHLDGQAAQKESVPDNRTAYEVVVR